MNQSKITSKLRMHDLAGLFCCAAAILLFALGGRAQTTAFVQQSKLQASDGAGTADSHGFSVAISGDTAIVGAPRNGVVGFQSRGAAYIYVRSGNSWTQQQKLIPSDGLTTDQFGYSVAINGNTAAVGRYNTTTGQNRSDGKVYIFTRTGTTWTETQILVSNDLAQGDSFGYSLAFEGDTLAVGARNKQVGANLFQGAAYIFTRPTVGGNFTRQARLTASDGGQADFFGESVSLSGDTALIGSVNDFGQTNARGKAYVFVRSGSTWTEQQILQSTGGSPNDAFGTSVSVSGDSAVIGANTEPIGTTGELGAAYVFVRNGAVWTQQQRFTAQETTPRNDRFGFAVAIRGDTIAIGSPAHEFVGSIANHGAIYVYNRSGAVWTRTQKLIHNDVAPDALGTSVAFDGSSIISGAPSKDSARGASYIFNSISTNGQSKLIGEAFVNPQYGQSAAISGDTAAVGSNIGVYIFNRAGANWGFVQKVPATVNGTTTIAPGSSVAISGDTMVIGAGGSRINGNIGQGAVLVYIRNGANWVFQQQLLASDGATGDAFGKNAAISGDTIVVGADADDNGTIGDQGSAYIFTRGGTTWTQQQKITAADGAESDFFGSDVAISGETVVIGAEDDDFGTNGAVGSAYIFTRSGTNWTQQAKISANDGGPSDRFGKSVDIDGNTIVVGSYQASLPVFRAGAAYVFTRSSTNWTQQQKLIANDGATFDGFGYGLALSGDRIAVGAFGANNSVSGITDTGAVYTFTRSGSSWTQRGKILAFDGANADQLGTSVAISNNYIVSGAVGDDFPGVNDQGSAYIFDLNTELPVSNTPDFDYDGDGKSDLSVFRPSNGTWYLQNSTSGFSAAQFGAANDKIVPADYDGDGKTDIAVYRNGNWYLQRSQAGFTGIAFGSAEDIPVPADYDGDGKADLAVFRPSNGTWYRLNSADNQFFAVQFGANGDKPTLGDFDGDGKADIAVFRPSNGTWYRLNSSNSQVAAVQFGAAEDSAVPADYDGDGKTDLAVFRPSNGTWYLQRSSLGFTGIAFGQFGDKPAPADYDGDGKADVAVYRAGVWYLQQSQAGFLGTAFGANNDLPAPNAFVR